MGLRVLAYVLALVVLVSSDVPRRVEALVPASTVTRSDMNDDWDEDDDEDFDDEREDGDDDDGDDDGDDDDRDDDGRGAQARGYRNGSSPVGDHFLTPGAQGRDGSSLVRGPYLQMATSTAITIRWRTSAPAGSCVRYGTSRDRMQFLEEEPGETTDHEVRLEGLRPDTRYYYSVGTSHSALAAGQDCSFRTAPPIGAERRVRVWIIGDSGLRGSAQQRVQQAYDSYAGGAATDVWLLLGDNAYDAGTSPQYQAGFFDPYRTRLRSTAVWPSRGNHDVIRKGPGNDYFDFFTLPTAGEAGGTPSGTEAYFSFDFANVHFVCLDAEKLGNGAGSAMIQWLRNDLMETSQSWRIAYFHHPPYSKGSHDSDSDDVMIQARRRLVPALEEGGVDLVVCGHSHSYERSYLLDGHYGNSASLTPSMILDRGDGRPDGSGAYRKPAYRGSAPHQGTVYAVVGSSSKLSGGRLDHRAHAKSLHALGSLVLDISGARLEAAFVDDRARAADRFTIVKGEGPSAARGAGTGHARAGRIERGAPIEGGSER